MALSDHARSGGRHGATAAADATRRGHRCPGDPAGTRPENSEYQEVRMTLDQFRELAEIWGGDIDRWPAATQDAAREIATNGEGGRILKQQLRLDRLFSIAPDVSDQRAGRLG